MLASANLAAQSVSFVNVSPDARTLSMGGASLASEADAYSLYNNPSAMALGTRKMAVGASYTLWQPKTARNALSGVAGFGKIGDKLAIGAGVRYFTHQPYNLSGPNGVITGSYTPKEYAAELGVAYRIIPGLSVGAAAHFIGSDLSEQGQTTAIAADVAATYSVKGFTASVGATNIGGKIKYATTEYALPSMGRFGLGYTLHSADTHRVSVTAEGDYLLDSQSVMGGLGIEYAFREMVAVRAGYHYGEETKGIPSYASAGIGVCFAGITLDAAYLIAGGDSPLKNSLSVSLGYRF